MPDGGWQSDYAYLLGLYLGDGFVREQIHGSAVLSIACADAWPGLRQECVVAMRAVLPVTVRTTPSQACSYVESASDHWRCLFPQHGRGRRHERRITPEDWQCYVGTRHTGRLVRGLFHSDGWRGQNVVAHRDGRRYRYPRYEFTNKSDDIMRICQDAFTRLDIAWRMSGRYRLSVARRGASSGSTTTSARSTEAPGGQSPVLGQLLTTGAVYRARNQRLAHKPEGAEPQDYKDVPGNQT